MDKNVWCDDKYDEKLFGIVTSYIRARAASQARRLLDVVTSTRTALQARPQYKGVYSRSMYHIVYYTAPQVICRSSRPWDRASGIY